MSDSLPSVNGRAAQYLQSIMDKLDLMNVTKEILSNGAVIMDFSKANMEGGLALSRVCMGDLAEIRLAPVKAKLNAKSGEIELDTIEVKTSYPIIACMGAQYAGWGVKVKKVNDKGEKKTHFKCMGSGPARSLALTEKELFAEIKYKDNADKAVLVLETNKKPDELVAEYVAKKTGVDAKNVYLLFAPTACLAGSVQISARIVETSIHKLMELGIHPDWIVEGYGKCPIAPVAEDDFKAMGWTNDCIILTGDVELKVDIPESSEAELVKLLKQCPSTTSSSYGKPFAQIFKDAGGDFYKIDPGVFAPAKVTITNKSTGHTFTEGKIAPEILDFS